VQSWPKSYQEGGIERLLQDKRGGNRAAPSMDFSSNSHRLRLELFEPKYEREYKGHDSYP
jgi:hypothetical protein